MNSHGKLVSDTDSDDPKAVPGAVAGDASQAAEPDVRLDTTAQALIGQHLRTIYDEIRQQEVPEHLLQLLDELERKERRA